MKDCSVSSARVTANSAWLLASRLGSQMFGLLLTVMIARRLGQDGLGNYAFITAVIFVANVITTFGTDTLLIRQAAAARGSASSWPDALQAASLWIQLALSTLVILVIFLLDSRLARQSAEAIQALNLYSLSLLPLAFYTVFSAALRGGERMDLYLVLCLAGAGFQALFSAFALLSGGGVVALAVALLAGQGVAALVSGWLCTIRLAGFRFRWLPDKHSMQAAWRGGLPLASLAVLAVVYQRMGILMLGLLAPAAAAGWFSAAARLSEACKLVPFAVFGAFLPALARQASLGHAWTIRSTPGYRTATGLVKFLSLLAAVGLSLGAAPLVRWLYGPGYEPAAATLRWLAWSLPPYAYSAQISVELIASRREALVLKASLAAVLAAGLLSWMWVHTQGAIGASQAVLAAETLQALLLALGTSLPSIWIFTKDCSVSKDIHSSPDPIYLPKEEGL